MFDLLLAVLVYVTTAITAVVFAMDTKCVRRWRAIRRTRRTTRRIWARNPSSRPRQRPNASHSATTAPHVEARAPTKDSPEGRRAS